MLKLCVDLQKLSRGRRFEEVSARLKLLYTGSKYML